MPRAPNPLKKKAHKLYMSGMKPAEIARKLKISDGMIRRWKKEDGWDNERSDETNETNGTKSNVRKPRGAPKGNRNAVGNIGGGAPVGSKNHLIHGFYYDVLTDEEKVFVDTRGEISEEQRLLNELNLWEIKERRLMQEIARQKASPGGLAVRSIVKDGDKTITTANSILENVIHLENLLTAAQRGHLRCIEKLYELRHANEGEGDGNMDSLMESIDEARKKWGDD